MYNCCKVHIFNGYFLYALYGDLHGNKANNLPGLKICKTKETLLVMLKDEYNIITTSNLTDTLIHNEKLDFMHLSTQCTQQST